MPIYCYRDTSGKVHDRHFPMGEAPAWIVLPNGQSADRDLAAEHGGTKSRPGCWPMYSEAAGCHPDQVKEYTEEARRRGVPTEITPDGRVKFETRHHRKRFCEAFGMFDRGGGYGDPQKR